MRILYNSRLAEYKTPFGVMPPNVPCTMHIRIPRSCCTVSVSLVVLNDTLEEIASFPFGWLCQDDFYDTYRCQFSMAQTGLYFYRFQITTQHESFRLFRQGDDTNMEAGDYWQFSVIADCEPLPDIYSGAVMYQIFPDRFHREGFCDCREKLQPYWVHENTADCPNYLPDADGKILNNDFFGGNLKGIQAKLPYLHDLGVEILYLNPIFMAWSNHRYDTYDYRRIDPMLGTQRDFTDLCSAAHALGMRVLLDGVFSHVGDRSPYFRDACENPDSPYADWFTFRHYPDDYETWWGIRTLPKVNKCAESYLQEIIDGPDSVISHWLNLGADGFRLDVADELPEVFLDRLRKKVRTVNPDAIVIGEVWEDASNKIAYNQRRHYFTRHELDSVMNYPWKDAILRYVRKEDDGCALAATVMQLCENYPPQVLSRLMNILSTHDTVRALQALVDPEPHTREAYADITLTKEQYALGASRLQMASFLQFTLPGMACIYYGDEAGMAGGADPFNRCFYPWGQENKTLLSHYRTLAKLKKTCLPLRKGSLQILQSTNGIFRFERAYQDQTVHIVCNTSDDTLPLTYPGSILYANALSVTPDERFLLPGGFALILESNHLIDTPNASCYDAVKSKGES